MNFDVFVVLVYVVGYILTLLFLVAFGKSWFGINYDKWSKTSEYDDWDSNAQAFSAWSLFWPMLWVGSAIYFSFKTLVYITQFLIDLIDNKHESHPQKQEG